MEIFIACSIAILETTFVLVGLLLLHGLRKLIGRAAFFIAMGSLLVLTQLVSATELKISLSYPEMDIYIAHTVLFLPYLCALMVIYVTEGTLEAQRLIVGAMATLGFYVYLSYLTAIQCNWLGYTISQGPSADSLDFLLRQSQRTMAGSILAQTLDLFLIPIFFQRLRNLKCNMFISVIGALMLTQVVDNFLYVTACYWGEPKWWLLINSSYFAKSILTIWLSIFVTLYITRIEKEMPGKGRGTLDIIFAFFGSYGRAQELQQSVIRWEGRYRMVVENASDMILIMDEKGKILDANFATIRIFQQNAKENIIGKFFPEMILDKDGNPVDWNEYCRRFKTQDTSYGTRIQRLECFVKLPGAKERKELDIAITSIIGVEKTPLMIVLGRDVTERNRLSSEREELMEQLAHTQRLDSVGKLAGGVAHDFNNYLHAIQGHLDLIKYMHDLDDEGIIHHLEKIDDVTEKAGQLTQQLLGFARKGKFWEKKTNLNEIIEQTIDLFTPSTQEDIEFETDILDEPMPVIADAVQLQQVFLNILLNARDAVKNLTKDNIYVHLKAGEASKLGARWSPPGNVKVPKEDYYCVLIEDNGQGIDRDIINHIFEPFFTTKPFGEGSGMGLAMAYGTITNHKGWINVNSKKDKGTTFYVYLPKVKKYGQTVYDTADSQPDEPT